MIFKTIFPNLRKCGVACASIRDVGVRAAKLFVHTNRMIEKRPSMS